MAGDPNRAAGDGEQWSPSGAGWYFGGDADQNGFDPFPVGPFESEEAAAARGPSLRAAGRLAPEGAAPR